MSNEGQGASIYISGEELKRCIGGDRIVTLTPEGMRTVTDKLILVEQAPDDSSINSTAEVAA